jgi:pentatricopeptide repeat protein
VLKHFEQMQHEGVRPNEVTYCCVLKACGSIKAAGKGQEIHMEILRQGLELRDISLGKTLVGMYTKCGLLSKGRDVFDNLAIRDVMTWTSMISGYAEHGFDIEALRCLDQMQRENIDLNAISYVCCMKACGNIGALTKSHHLHTEILFKGYEDESSVANGLISTYAKCGAFEEAWLLFDNTHVRDVVTWCSMIKGYALNHQISMALHCFKSMQKQSIQPDAVTFICIINACCQNGMLSEACHYFEEMETLYGLVPSIEHYSCIVDILARSGYLYEAEHFLEMLLPPPEAMWTALLNASKIYGDEEVGMRCFKLLVELSPEDATWYVMMSDLYLSIGKLEDSLRVEEMRKLARAEKKPAVALIELDDKIHEFVVGTNGETRNSWTMRKLMREMKMDGYFPELDQSRIQSM